VLTETIPNPDPGALDLARAEARLPRWMFAAAALAVTLSGIVAGLQFALGLALGAALAILNYFWLHQAIETLMRAGQQRVPRLVIAKFALRYPAALALLYLLYRTGWFSFPAILAGLFVPVAGVLIEAVVQLSSGWRVN
jgi:ATP synthase I subunit